MVAVTASFPILTFHSVDQTGSVISMPPARFAAIMRDMAAAGWHGTTVSGAIDAWRARGPSARTFGISFDDAYRNVVSEALPVLADLGFAATVFVIAGRAGADNRWPGQPASIPVLDLADWPDLHRLVQGGWEIGSHGYDHATLSGRAAADVEDELKRARSLLETRLGVETPLLAYPYGGSDQAALEAARRVHAGACTARLGLVTERDLVARFLLPRIDAYYLRRRSAPALLDSAPGRAWLTARRWARRLRRH